MGVNISYMGTKRHLAPAVCDVIRHAQKGILLDAFAGTCSVGEQIGLSRQVWTNDIQIFASEVARALFTSRDEPLDAVRTADMLFDEFLARRERLCARHKRSLRVETALLESRSFTTFSGLMATLCKQLSGELRTSCHRGNLFTLLYSNSYFGIQQSIEADAILGAIRTVHRAELLSDDHRRWLTIALGRALLRVANSTGHFAQYLKPHQSSYKRYISQRKRDLWGDFLVSTGELSAVGDVCWRRRNKSFNQDSLELLPALLCSKEIPSVVYADPPYTDDQYSRFYHIFETLILYDYPAVSGAGLYRPDRFSSSFSLKSKAATAFENLVTAAAKLGADLVLSYPTNGLVHEAGASPRRILSKYYRRVECSYSLSWSHSTFGASKGPARSKVTERIYLAKS
jgi:adenine-specific DNA-methyltransferase